MNFCNKCGTSNREGARFCSRCGNIMEKGKVYSSGQNLYSHSSEEDDEIDYSHVDYEYDDKYFGPPKVIDEDELKRALARRLIQGFAIPAAVLVAVRIPFSDIFFLLPLQCAMIASIGKVYNRDLKPEKVFMEIAAAAGFSVLGEIAALIVSNFVPFIGGIITAPFVYGWTWGMGEVAIKYFESQEINDEEMRTIYRQASYQAYDQYKEHKMTKEESLEKLKGHLTPEEYEKIKRKFQ